MRRILLFTGICIGLLSITRGQVVVQFVPELQGRTTDGLMLAKFSSLYTQTIDVSVELVVVERKQGRTVSINTGSFALLPGLNTIHRSAVSSAVIRFAENNAARLLRQSGVFPEGEYEYCFRVYKQEKNARGELLGEQCFEYAAEPLTPLFLIEPYLKETLCDKRPPFTWQPSLPAIPGAQYRVTVSEMKAGQSAVEALAYNLPLINQSGITAPMLFYPPAAKELEEGKSYAWQVTVYKEGMILNRSEIWEFSLKCNDTPAVEKAEGFRDIEDLARGNYYIAEGKIMFAVYNAYAETNLEYSIFCLNKPAQRFKRLPKLRLKRGNNNIVLDLKDNRSFTDGFHYIMTVRLPNKTEKKLRFIYKSGS